MDNKYLVHKKSSRTVSRVLYVSTDGWWHVSVIYLLHESPHGSSVLPSTAWAPALLHCCSDLRQLGRATLYRVVYMNLQLPRCTADMSPCRWWALTSPSHHFCPKAVVIFFCITQPSRTASTLGSGMPYAARTFLFRLYRAASDRPSGCFRTTKVRKKWKRKTSHRENDLSF